MGGRLRRWWPLPVVAVAVLAVIWLLYVVWRSPHRSDLATYGAFAFPVLVLAVGWIVWAWRRARTSPARRGPDSENLDRVADLLAQAVQKQWSRAAGERGLAGADPIEVSWGRPSLPLAGPVAVAARSPRFVPLPGLAPAREDQLAAGQLSDLYTVYGGLGSGRLIIAGAPGSGKSGAAVLLVLAALEHRERLSSENRPKVPVPVLFTAQDWDPRRQLVADWLTRRLQEAYPLFTGMTGAANAAELIAARKVAVILDGLDEITEELRPVALQALSQQADFRVVVLSRTAELASATSRYGVLQGAAAIELRAIGPEEAASYLERIQRDPAPEGWRDLIERIRSSPGSPLSKALDSPLTLTLVRDTYQSGDDARELLNFCDTIQQDVDGDRTADEITGHLLDRVLPAAYAHRPGQPPPRYDLPAAQNAFAKIAARMNQDGTRDLQWWTIHHWAPAAQRFIGIGLVAGVGFGAAAGVAGGLIFGPRVGFGVAVATVPTLGLGFGLTGVGTDSPPRKIGRPRLRRAMRWDTLTGPLVAALGIGLVMGLAFGLLRGSAAGVAAGVAGAVVGLIAGALQGGLGEVLTDPADSSSPSPVGSWRGNRSYAITEGVAAGVAGGVAGGLIDGLANGPVAGIAGGLAIGVVAGVAGGLAASRLWPSSLAAAQLAARWHTPVHLLRFLEDARERNVLRTVGPVYQFRHARLQDRLAVAQAPNPMVQAASTAAATSTTRKPHAHP